MRIVTARRISQVFFLVLLYWLCFAATLGSVRFWQLRGWPVNWLLQLDPLVAIATVLATGTLFAGLVWSLLTIALTIIFGRFFCGWVCPFGTMHQFFGWLGRRGRKNTEKIKANRYRPAQRIKYYILLALLAAAIGGALIPGAESLREASLQIGLLDPIPLVYRSVNLVLLPIDDATLGIASPTPRLYEYGWLIGGVFIAAILLNFVVPRFYCRFLCPLGALLGILGRWSIWRFGKCSEHCVNCGLCETDCEGACEPAGQIRTSECVLCANCLGACPEQVIAYQRKKSISGEVTNPDISRRGVLAAIVAGLAAPSILRLGGTLGDNWNHKLIRPPGSLDEERFLARCIKCGQCMRICPTNVIQPAGLEGGIEGFLTPRLNNRIGTSGCQFNCVTCSQICPTAAIRPLSMDEKMGVGEFADAGPVKMGTAFLDRGRCLPWAMGKPCIVCQENCPISPKAIYVREIFQTVRDGVRNLNMIQGYLLELDGPALQAGSLATGDYYCKIGNERKRIAENSEWSISLSPGDDSARQPQIGDKVELQIRLQRPFVDPAACIGCGVCEHECPVSGKRAIRVSAEGESRSRDRSLLA